MDKTIEAAFQKKFAIIRENSYDKGEQLVYENVAGRNYHTAVTAGRVHRTRENAEFAIGLLRMGGTKNTETAASIFRQVLALQDTNPASATYGIWPYLFEEPLDKMLNPDWNWASFIGRTLIIALQDFPNLLPEELKQKMKAALEHAGASIERRNMGVDYTNICIMSSFVIAVSGELLGRRDFYAFGLDKLQRLLEFVRLNGSISEYNSPDYGLIDLEETGHILRYAKSPELQRAAEELNRVLWRDMAAHFHAPTGQLAPPHTRCYENIKGDRLLSLFEIGTNGRWDLLQGRPLELELLWPLTVLRCPDEFVTLFAPLLQPRFSRMQYYQGVDTIHPDEVRVLTEKGQPPVTASTWMHPDYCVGSFDRHDLWNQRRPLMAYFKNGGAATAFRVRCMHDEMDYASAVITTAQIENDLAAAIGFVTDHGDYHYILDPLKNNTITANRFCVRFELDGCLDKVSVTRQGEDYIFCVDDIRARLHFLQCSFGGQPIACELFRTEHTMGLELVLYAQPDGRIAFDTLENAAVLFGLHFYMQNEDTEMPRIETARDGTRVQLTLYAKERDCQTTWIDTTPAAYTQGHEAGQKIFKMGGFLYHV